VVAPYPAESRGLDYNLKRFHELTVRVVDQRGLASEFRITVEVLDVNDPPIMLPVELSVPENAHFVGVGGAMYALGSKTGQNYYVGAVAAFDPDTVRGAELKYYQV
jgi:hypothetical protein